MMLLNDKHFHFTILIVIGCGANDTVPEAADIGDHEWADIKCVYIKSVNITKSYNG